MACLRVSPNILLQDAYLNWMDRNHAKPVTGHTPFKLRYLVQADYATVRQLHEETVTALNKKGWDDFYKNITEEEIRAYLGNENYPMGREGITIGAFHQHRLIAKGSARLPQGRDDFDKNAPVYNGLLKQDMAYFQSAAVSEDYQGNGIHKQLYQLRLDMAQALGRVGFSKHHVNNTRSWSNALSKGAYIAFYEEKEKGERKIFAKFDHTTPQQKQSQSGIMVDPDQEWQKMCTLFNAGFIGTTRIGHKLLMTKKQ